MYVIMENYGFFWGEKWVFLGVIVCCVVNGLLVVNGKGSNQPFCTSASNCNARFLSNPTKK